MDSKFKEWLKSIDDEHEEMERLYGKKKWKPGGWTQLVGDRDEEGQVIRDEKCWALFRVYFRRDCHLHKWINHDLNLVYAGETRDEEVIGGIDVWGIDTLIPEIDWKLEPLSHADDYLLDLWDGKDPESTRNENQFGVSLSQAPKKSKIGQEAPNRWYCYETDSLIFTYEEGDFECEHINQFLTLHKRDDKIVGARLDYASRLNREISEHRNILSKRRRNSSS